MSMYVFFKHLHVTMVFLTIISFFFRGIGHLFNQAWVNRKPVKILPHVIDTILIVSAIATVLVAGFKFTETWILVKIIGLFLYVYLGLMAFRFAKTRMQKAIYWLLALALIFYLAAVAGMKSPIFF